MNTFLTLFTPENYNLTLTVNRTSEATQGTVIITGTAHSDHISLHAVDMTIQSVKVDNAPVDFTHKDDALTITLPAKSDAIAVKIDFTSTLRHDMQGCYLSAYTYEGKEERIATTQFESHYARTCFPCIDEPAAKATFDLTLLIPDLADGDVVLANTPVKSHKDNQFTFSQTPKMSTYLLAWVIGKFHCVETTNANGVKVASYAALNQPLSSLEFANETAARALEFYDKKFGCKYPLPKLDQVAIPDFEAGAMENWGLVTYRESMMLAAPAASIDTKSCVAVTITHELSHQWFGDLVTMAWWDDLWLNESFASIMEYYCADALYPEFRVWEDFYTSDCVAALRRDALRGVQAVMQPVEHPAEIATLFDGAIVYAKGARLVLMLIHLLGEENFDRGLRDYFAKHAYGNTVGDDLWAALQPYADFDIKSFMHAWISQPGYPKIKISTSISAPQKNAGQSKNPTSPIANKANIEQRRFLLDGTTDDTKWPLPEIFDDMSGHYLLELSSEDFAAKLANFDSLSVEQKLRLLLDRSLLAKTPAVSAASLLDLIPKFTNEPSGAVLLTVTSLIGDLKIFCPHGTPEEAALRRFLAQTFKHNFDTLDLGDLGGDSNAIHRRDMLLGLALYTRDPETQGRLAALYTDNLEQIDSELLSAVIIAELRRDEAAAFPRLFARYKAEANPELRLNLIANLACEAELPENCSLLLSLLEQPAVVRPQDHLHFYIYLLRNPHTRSRALAWLYTHWDFVAEIAGEKSIEDYARIAAAAVRTQAEADAFFAFFDDKRKEPVLARTIEIADADIPARLALLASDTPAVSTRLTELTKA